MIIKSEHQQKWKQWWHPLDIQSGAKIRFIKIVITKITILVHNLPIFPMLGFSHLRASIKFKSSTNIFLLLSQLQFISENFQETILLFLCKIVCFVYYWRKWNCTSLSFRNGWKLLRENFMKTCIKKFFKTTCISRACLV